MNKILWIFILVSITLIFAPQTVQADWYINSNGRLAYEFEGVVLGTTTDTDAAGNTKTEVDTSDIDVSSEDVDAILNVLKAGEASPYAPLLTADSDQLESKLKSMLQHVKVYKNELGEVETIVTDPETGAISKTQVKDGKIVTEVTKTNGEVEVLEYDASDKADELKQLGVDLSQEKESEDFEFEKGHDFDLKAGTEGVDIDVKDNEATAANALQISQKIVAIESHADNEKIKVTSTKAGKLVVAQGRVAATTDKDLSVESATNSLLVTTELGKKRIDILPPAAVSSLLAADVIDEVKNQDIDFDIANVEKVVILTEQDGNLVYEIEGLKKKWFFGLVPIQYPKRVTVSAETGELLATKVELMDRIIDFFSL